MTDPGTISEGWAIAIFSGVIAISLGLFAAITGFLNLRRTREFSVERAIGTLEGKASTKSGGSNEDNGAGRIGGNIMETLGILKQSNADIKEDIAEMKTNQKENRAAQALEFKTLKETVDKRINKVSGEVGKMRRELHLKRATTASGK